MRPLTKLPSRSLGPCKSARMPIGRPVSASTRRIAVNSLRWSSWVPWLKLQRKTSTPASNSARKRSGLELAGPSVATILALRCRRIAGFLARVPRSAAWLRENEDGAKVVDIGQRRSRDHKVANGMKEPPGIVLGHRRLDGDAVRRGAG